MVRLLLGYNAPAALDVEESPREILKTPSPVGENGWLIRFFDSAFFCEWIAVSYLYKHEHQGVRDYLCNRMYTLSLTGIENYLFQLCFMTVYKPSAALEKFMVDICSKSLKIALKVHWFLLAEAEDVDDVKELNRLMERCQMAAMMGDWPPLVQPRKTETSPGSKNRMFKLLSSHRLLNITSSPPQKGPCQVGSQTSAIEEDINRNTAEDVDSSLKVLKKLMPGSKVQSIMKKFHNKDDEESDRPNPREGESENFFRRMLRERDDEEKSMRNDETGSSDRFFRWIFKDKSEAEVKVCSKAGEEDGFFRRLFRDKCDDRERPDVKEITDDEEKRICSIDEDEVFDFSLFRRFYRVHPEENEKPPLMSGSGNVCENSPGSDGFFKRLFKDRNAEDSKMFHLWREDGASPSSIFKKIFKDKNDCVNIDNKDDIGDILKQDLSKSIHPGSVKNGLIEGRKLFEAETQVADGPRNSIISELNSKLSLEESKDCSRVTNGLFSKRPGSPKQKTERSAAKPPLPKYSPFQLRKGTFHATLDFVQSLCETSSGLVDVYPMEDRKKALYESLVELNVHLVKAQIDGGICFPLGKDVYRVLHIPENEATLLNSREKAPYLICMEVVRCDGQSNTKEVKDAGCQKPSHGGIPLANGDAQLQRPPPWAYPVWNQSKVLSNNTDAMHRAASQAIDRAMSHLWETKVKFVHVGLTVADDKGRYEGDLVYCNHGIDDSAMDTEDSNMVSERHKWVHVHLTAVPGVNMDDIEVEEPVRRKDHRRVPSTIAMAQVKEAAAKGHSPLGPVKKSMTRIGHGQSEGIDERVCKATDALAGELWEVKKERIRRKSRFGNMAGWDLRSVIVKSGDDCRQEHLAVQLISHFYDIFQEAGLPLWLRPYEVLVTSSYTALIETIPDTASIHSIKSRNPSLSSLREFFCKKYQENSPAMKLAQRNFVESMAGYSILCYFLQVKDRHNGNLLIDEEGHIMHIDFGFMLSNSPGGVNFESAPFKLTRELLEVMDSDAEGTPSEFFDYFKVLCIQGFLTCRKHAERIILLVEMMQGSGFPCFKGGVKTIQNLRKRFHLSLTEEQCVSLVLSLISNSLDAWRTRQYDYYQRVLNGIL